MVTRNPKGHPSGKGGKEQAFTLDEVERALRHALGNRSIAASVLGCTRESVQRYVAKYPERLGSIRPDCRREVADLGEAELLKALHRGAQWAVQLALRLYGNAIGVGESLDLTSNGEPLAVAQPVTFNISYVQSRHKGSQAAEQREADSAHLMERKNHGV